MSLLGCPWYLCRSTYLKAVSVAQLCPSRTATPLLREAIPGSSVQLRSWLQDVPSIQRYSPLSPVQTLETGLAAELLVCLVELCMEDWLAIQDLQPMVLPTSE